MKIEYGNGRSILDRPKLKIENDGGFENDTY